MFFIFTIQGFYAFINKGQRYDDAGLVYKGFTGSKCLTFWYHMNGRGIGWLQVWVDDMDVLVLKGAKGNAWKKAQVQITGKRSTVGIKAFQLILLIHLTKCTKFYFVRY